MLFEFYFLSAFIFSDYFCSLLKVSDADCKFLYCRIYCIHVEFIVNACVSKNTYCVNECDSNWLHIALMIKNDILYYLLLIIICALIIVATNHS